MTVTCKLWRVRVVDDDRKTLDTLHVWSPTKLLARLSVRGDHPWTWGHTLVISKERNDDS